MKCPTLIPFRSNMRNIWLHPKRVGERVAVISGDRDSLFSAIYLVRCNLFHGNKDVACERDMRLAAQGGGILIGILTALSHA